MRTSELERIVGAHADALSRMAWGYVTNAADHDDLLQEMLIAVWRALPRFRGDASERTYIYRIAHNRGTTFANRRAAHEPLAEHDAIADSRPGPDEQLDAAGQRARLVAAVRQLPPVQRQVVMLRLEGFSIAEIAAMQDVTENNVSVRLARSRERLRQLLREEDEEDRR